MVFAKIFDQLNRIQIKSITDSIFKYGLLLVAVAAVCGIFKSPIWITAIILALGVLFLIVGLYQYCYFARKNPDYLRSESFQIQKKSIEMLGDKDNELNPNIKEIILIASPYARNNNKEENNEIG